MSERRDDLIAFLDATLEAAAFPDYGPMGLQVVGSERVERVVTAVSSSLALFEQAAQARAQLVVVHHGLFWDRDSRVVSRVMRDRLRALFDADINLAAYHLALDAHDSLGNNAQIVRALGLEPESTPFAVSGGQPIGKIARATQPLSPSSLVERVETAIGRPHATFMHGPSSIRQVAVCSGSGASFIQEAQSLGADALLTGDMAEPAEMQARELGIHFIAAGHYATEVFGVRALAGLIAEQRDCEASFLDLPTIA
ncbi:MAG: Nif3-like dinuclear metal center hexameric protein [Chloroflexi bacterium]|nr:Nif3-like dinuclear metal center hexameric protein [Chloroflexota bacterium]